VTIAFAIASCEEDGFSGQARQMTGTVRQGLHPKIRHAIHSAVWVGCHIDLDKLAPSQPNNDQNVEQAKDDGRNHEQIHSRDVRRMVAQKRASAVPNGSPFPAIYLAMVELAESARRTEPMRQSQDFKWHIGRTPPFQRGRGRRS
jgi:hypothetical protein